MVGKLDTYGVAKALRCRTPEAYLNIERMLIYGMRSLPLPPGFREHAEDMLLGTPKLTR